MDVERAIVSAIARTQTIHPVLARQIEPHHFVQRDLENTTPVPLPGEVYSWIIAHYKRFNAVPSLMLTRQRWPRFEFIDTSDTLDALVEHFTGLIKQRGLAPALRQLAAIYDDPSMWADAEIHAFAVIAEYARGLPSSSVTRLSDSMTRLEMHRRMQAEGRAPGITMLTPDLDNLTFGVQPGELMIWEGFLGGGKSSCAMGQSAREYAERNRTSLVFSLEMEGQKLANRWEAAMAGFAYDALKFMEMRGEDYEKWARFAERVYEARFEKDVIVIDDVQHCSSERIHAEVERWRPDFFIVDTVDEIRAPSWVKGMYEQTRHAIMELKGVCRATKLPGIGVAQSGREAEEAGATLGNIAGAIDIARKADLVVGLHATPQMKRSKMIELRMLKNRDGQGDGLKYTYYRDPATLTIRPWRPEDAVPIKDAQAAPAPVPAPS